MKTRILSLIVALFATITLNAYDFQYGDLFYNITSESTVEVVEDESYSELTVVVIPSTLYDYYDVTSIGDYAFSGCSGLESVTLGNSVTSIGDYAFSGCTGLTSITIPNSVTSIGRSAFSGCESLTSIVVENGNKVYDSRNNCNAIIETSTNTLIQGCKTTIIPNSVTSIGDYAFFGCTGLISITIPNSVTSIGDYAFFGCTGLISITIPNSVTSIGDGAFYCCKNIETVVFGKNVKDIGESAFAYCSKIYEMTIYATTTPTIEENTFENVSEIATLYVPKGCVKKYKIHPYWGVFDIVEMEDTGVSDIEIKNTPKRFIRDGQVLIQHNGKTYTISGNEIK